MCCHRCAMSRPNIGSIHSRFSKAINSSRTRGSLRLGEASAFSLILVRAICCCKANARNFSPKNGPGSPQPFSGSASSRKNCSTEPLNAAQRRQPQLNRTKGLTKRRSTEPMTVIEARSLRKTFGTTVAVDGIDLRVEEGRILGLIGPNGAGKTTALNAIVGLTSYQGELKVLGRDPWTERDQLMRDVCFITDVAVLPRWIKVSQALDYVAGIHPRFDRAKAESFLAKTTIRRASRVKELSKGMVAQLHLALVMAIDAKLLVLDEPTLGLDILYRKQFYDSLLNDYFDGKRTILVTTHQVEEIQDVLTDVAFIHHGRIVLGCTMEELQSRFAEVTVNPEQLAAARALKPIHERQVFGRGILLFDRLDRQQLSGFGDVRSPSIADLFVAVIGNQAAPAQANYQGAAR